MTDTLDTSTLAEIRLRLEQLREELQSTAATNDASSGTVELDQSRVGRLSRMDALQAQAMSQASARRRQETLRNIERALRRIDDKEFGDCQDCGELIARQRLLFDPTVALCIRCAELQEKS